MKAKKIIVPIVIVLIITALLFGGLFVFKKFFYKDTSYVGKWERKVDVTNLVTGAMDLWLDSALVGDGIEYGDGCVEITVCLEIGEGGQWTQTISDESYENARQQAIDVAAAGLRDFLGKRLEAADTPADSVGKTVDELIEEALGMSAEEYLEQYGPQLLPDADTFREEYEATGAYTVKGDVFARTGITDGTLRETFASKDGYLIFTAQSDDESVDVKKTGMESLAVSINDGGASDSENDETEKKINYPVVYSRVQ